MSNSVMLKDVAYHVRNHKAYVQVPLPERGTYEIDGTQQALTATLVLDESRITPNKKQIPGENKRGWTMLSPNYEYTLHWSAQENASIHSELIRVSTKMTGADIAANNEKYGKPALDKTERDRKKAAEEASKPQQLTLFDPDDLPKAPIEVKSKTPSQDAQMSLF